MEQKSTPATICFVHELITDENKRSIRKKICKGLDAKYKQNGKDYCILHCPDDDKDEGQFMIDFEGLLKKKKYDFRRIYFPKNMFFNEIKFGEIIKNKVDFSFATFKSEIKFQRLTFEEDVKFDSAIFEQEVKFSNVVFKKNVSFESVVFDEKSKVFFWMTNIQGVIDFYSAVIKNSLRFDGGEIFEKKNSEISTHFYKVFEGNYSRIDLEDAQIEHPEKIVFHSIRLQPIWFLNVDSKKFTFNDCQWEQSNGSKINVETEINIRNEIVRKGKKKVENSDKKYAHFRVESHKKLFAVTCRQLAENAENNNRFEEASNFRRMAFETEWIEQKEKILKWWVEEIPCSDFLDCLWQKIKTTPFDFAHLPYRLTSSYGESWSWAAFVLAIFIFAIFPFIYTQTEFQVSPQNIPLEVAVIEDDCNKAIEKLKKSDCKIENRGLNFWNGEAVAHSLVTATLQTVEYRIPMSHWAEFWIILEKIFSPLQAALLALAIRRKFMR